MEPWDAAAAKGDRLAYIADILTAHTTLREKLDRMLSKCLEAGGMDNITGVLAAI